MRVVPIIPRRGSKASKCCNGLSKMLVKVDVP
jgi:hypothetical protein